MHFNNEWLLLRPKECPSCRIPILLGDSFFIDENPKGLLTVSAKQLAIDNFLGTMRSLSNVAIWPQVNNNFVKHIVITDVSQCRPIDLIKEYSDRPNNFSVHVFYSAEQAAEMAAFSNAF